MSYLYHGRVLEGYTRSVVCNSRSRKIICVSRQCDETVSPGNDSWSQIRELNAPIDSRCFWKCAGGHRVLKVRERNALVPQGRVRATNGSYCIPKSEMRNKYWETGLSGRESSVLPLLKGTDRSAWAFLSIINSELNLLHCFTFRSSVLLFYCRVPYFYCE